MNDQEDPYSPMKVGQKLAFEKLGGPVKTDMEDYLLQDPGQNTDYDQMKNAYPLRANANPFDKK